MIRLIRLDPEKGMNRWYLVTVQPTLFDPVAVVCAWGSRVTAYQRLRCLPMPDREQAERRAREIVERKIRRGYRPERSQEGEG